MSDATNDARVNVYINGQSGIAEIDKLERRMLKLGKEINRVGKDTDLGRKMAAELKVAQAQVDKLTSKLDITKMSIRQLESESKRLRRLRDMAQPGTQEFANLNRQLGDVNKRMKVVQTGLGSFGQAWKLVWDQMKGFNMALVGVFAGGVVMNFFSKILKGATELSDQMANIRKTTGMTKDEVKELNKELGKLDTRTSRKDLLDSAIVAGQLGIAKKDIADFVKSVDVATVALGDEFSGGAQQVAEEMGKLRNVFSDIRSDKIDQDILRISNAINELGASGFATGPVVSENANRIGGYGIQVGLTTGQVLGLAAAQQELNISSERGSTAIIRILQKMLSEVETFAQVAGVPVDNFRKMLDTDLYGAFMMVMRGSKEVGKSNTQLAKIISDLEVDGAGASEVFAKFGTNIELVNQKVDLASDSLKKTDSIMQEFTLKNENAAAAAEKIGRAISGWFTRKFVEPAERFLVWLGHATGLMQTMSEKTQEERIQLMMAEIQLKNTNTTQEQRVKIIKELQDKYPDYLGNLNAETVSNEDLSKALKLVNDQLINKIIIQKKQEEYQEKAEEAANWTLKQLELEETIRRRMANLQAENPGVKLPAGDLVTQANSLLDQLDSKYSAFNVFSDFNKLQDDISLYVTGLKIQTSLTDKANTSLSERNTLMKRLGITVEETAKKEKAAAMVVAGGETPSSPSASSETSDKKDKAFKMSIDLRVSELERYSAAMKEVKSQIEQLYLSETEIAVAEATEKTDALIEENQRLQSEMLFAIQFGSKTERQFAQQRLRQLMDDEVLLYQERERKAVEATQKQEKAVADARKEAVKRIQNELKSPMQKEIDQVESHYAELIALAVKYGVDTSELVQKREAAIRAIQANYNVSVEKDKKESLKRALEEIVSFAQSSADILNPVVDLISNYAERQIAEIESVTQKRMEALEKSRAKGLVTEESYQKKKLAIEKKAQAEINRQKRKQMILDRIAAQAQVIFSTATAVQKSVAESPDTFGLPYSAYALISGGVQSAAIWSAPLPEYKKGGVRGGVPDGPTHERGGISLINSQTGRKVGEMEGNEPYMILSRETYKNNGALIDNLLNASMNEGGRMLRPDELMAGAPMIQMPRLETASNGRRAVNRTSSPSGGDGSAPKWAKQLMRRVESMDARNPIEVKAKVVLRDFEETKEEYYRVKDLANIGASNGNSENKTVVRTSSSAGGTPVPGPPGPPGDDGAPGATGANGAGLEHYWFHKF